MRTRFRASMHTAIDVILVLIGFIVLLLIGYVQTQTAKEQIAALATSLIAAGLIDFLVRSLHDEPTAQTIEMASDTRAKLDRSYRKRKYEAAETDIVSVALMNVLEEIAHDEDDKFLKHIVFDGAKVRLAFLSPSASYVRQRATEDGVPEEDLKATLQDSVRSCMRVFERLQAVYEAAADRRAHEPHGAGMFVIRAVDLCPYFSINRTDDEMLWGLYTSNHRGVYAPVFHVKRTSAVFEKLTTHFERLWTLSDQRDVVRYYHPSRPTINRPLVAQLLGERAPTDGLTLV